MSPAAEPRPESVEINRDERGFYLCPLCQTVRCWNNYEIRRKRLHWFLQCRSCETRFEEPKADL